MNTTDQQFEKIISADVLDEALTLTHAGKTIAQVCALFPHADQRVLAEFLRAAEVTQNYYTDERARIAFAHMMERVQKPVAKKSSIKKMFDSFFSGAQKPIMLGALCVIVLALGVGYTYTRMYSRNETPLANVHEINPTDITSSAGMGSTALSGDYIRNFDTQRASPPATDTREFFKIAYGATIQTRDVAESAERARTIIRGHGGRVDTFAVSEESGDITFVVPQSEYDAFKTELKSVVGERFLVVRESAENLLPQKQTLEQNTADATDRLARAQKNRADMVQGYEARIKMYENKIAFVDAALQKNKTDQSLVNARHALIKKLADEQSAYHADLADADLTIHEITDELNGLAAQDKTLVDTVATVSGTLVLEHINIFELVTAYVPAWVIGIFVAACVYGFWRKRSRTYNF